MITEESKVETESTGLAGENGATTGEINWNLVQLTVGYLILDHVVRGVALIPGLPRDFLLLLGVVLSFGLFWYALSKEPWLRSDSGLTWKQNPGSIPWGLACVVVLLSVGVYAAVVRDVEVRSLAVDFHNALAAPIVEELAYRGAR